MKLMKKVLSGLCALSLVMTTVASLAVNATESVPTLVPEVTVNETAGTATIVVKAVNVPTEVTGGGYTDPAFVFSYGCEIDITCAATDVKGLSGRDFTKWTNSYFTAGFLGGSPVQNEKAGYLSYGGAATDKATAVNRGQVPSEFVMFTIHDLPLSEDALKNGFTVKTANFQLVLNNEYWGTGDACEAKYTTAAGTAATAEDSWAPSATPEPTATATPTPTPVVTPEPTPTVEPTPEVTPEPTTGKGAITADANDAAAWAWKTAAAAGSSVKVTVNANGETATKAFALKAAVDGTVKVGVIVQYNPATFTSFEITDIVVE